MGSVYSDDEYRELVEAIRKEINSAFESPDSRPFQVMTKAAAYGAKDAIEEWAKNNTGCQHECLFFAEEGVARQIRALIPVIGEFEPREIRENHEFTMALRKKAEKIGMIVLSVITVTAVSGVIAAIIHYFRNTAK